MKEQSILKIIPKNIETFVLQVKNEDTQEVIFKIIPRGLGEKLKWINDSKIGIAGININGKIFHLTSKTPESLLKAGVEYAGSVTPQYVKELDALKRL